MFDVSKFGPQIKKHRELMGLTRPEFGLAADISYSLLNNIEYRQNIPTVKTCIKILNTLNLTFSECMEENSFNKKDSYKQMIKSILLQLPSEDLNFVYNISLLYKPKVDEINEL